MSSYLRLLGLLTCTALCFGCSRRPRGASEDSTESASPSSDRIDPSQFDRLGIVTVQVAREQISETRSAVGWLEAPPSSQQVLRAPISGFVALSPDNAFPALGQSVERNQSVAYVNVFLTPQEISQLVIAKEDTDVQMQQALVTMQLSEEQLNQAISAGNAITGVRINQLKEAVAHSKAAYKEAQQKLQFLITEPAVDGLLVKPVLVKSAIQGKVIQVHVTLGQFVIAGDPLMTIDNWECLWVRVPIFESDTRLIEPSSPAIYRDFVSGNSDNAQLILAPTETKPATRTVDYLYEIKNEDWKLRVGQSIVVELPVGKDREALMIPRSAVLYNSFGQPSCFVLIERGTTYVRKRIELGGRKGENIEVLRGLSDDDYVVSIGAEQLAADASKAELAAKDDD